MPMKNLFETSSDLLTVDDLCTITGLSSQTVRSEMRAGNLPARKIGRRWFVPRTALVAYFEGSTNERR